MGGIFPQWTRYSFQHCRRRFGLQVRRGGINFRRSNLRARNISLRSGICVAEVLVIGCSSGRGGSDPVGLGGLTSTGLGAESLDKELALVRTRGFSFPLTDCNSLAFPFDEELGFCETVLKLPRCLIVLRFRLSVNF